MHCLYRCYDFVNDFRRHFEVQHCLYLDCCQSLIADNALNQGQMQPHDAKTPLLLINASYGYALTGASTLI